MGRHVNSRGAGGRKITYEEWVLFRTWLARARVALSWRQISVACDMNEGWAQSADKHRSVVNEHGFRKMKQLVDSLSEEAVSVGVTSSKIELNTEPQELELAAERRRRGVIPIGDVRLRERFSEIVVELQKRNFTQLQISQAFGYRAWAGVHNALKRESVPEAWRVERAEEVLALVQQGKVEAALRECGRAQPLAKAPAPPTDAAFTREAIERAQMEAEAARRVAATAPEARPDPAAPQPRREEPAAPAPSPAPLRKPAEAPASLVAAVALPYGDLAEVRADLEKVLNRLELTTAQQPKFVRAAWQAKCDELTQLILSLE